MRFLCTATATGVPNSGKSKWLDALAVNLTLTEGWAIAFASFEKDPRHHFQSLVEILFGEPGHRATEAGCPFWLLPA